MTQTVLSSIVSLWRYPVKSMLGEELNSTEVSSRGLLGDRAYWSTAPTGRLQALRTRGSGRSCSDFRARLADVPRIGARVPSVRITLPDGTIVNSEQPDVNHIFSKLL
jgi:uncharacterized protein YcbX